MIKRQLYACLAICAVSCEVYFDLSGYNIEDQLQIRSGRRKFNIYWNVPTMQCTSKGIPIDDLTDKYGIIQNSGDTFRGDRIAIMYDPGFFPALLNNGSQKGYLYRNGGVPQEGDLDAHLQMFKQHVEEQIPDENFNGLGIINFESWKPIFRQNYGDQKRYQDVSIDIERKRHPFWPQTWVDKEAAKRLEQAGHKFMESTISLVKKLRPNAKWSYYAYPYCYNMGEKYKHPNCPEQVKMENNRLQWLWDKTTVLYPSVYLPKRLSTTEKIQLVRGRVREAQRVNPLVDINPYIWYKYFDDVNTFLTKQDFTNVIKEIETSGAAGAVIWGSSNDVNTKEKCQNLKKYVENVIGPVSSKYIANFNSINGKSSKSAAKTYRNGDSTYDQDFYYTVEYIYDTK